MFFSLNKSRLFGQFEQCFIVIFVFLAKAAKLSKSNLQKFARLCEISSKLANTLRRKTFFSGGYLPRTLSGHKYRSINDFLPLSDNLSARFAIVRRPQLASEINEPEEESEDRPIERGRSRRPGQR